MHPWRARLETILGPLARRTPLSPNALTALALLMNLAAAVIMAFGQLEPRLFLAAPVLIGVAGLLDGLDGLVARYQGKTSRWGDFLDHLCDRISDSALAAGWVVGVAIRLPIGVVAVLVVSLTGYVGTQTEATFNVREDGTVGRGEFVLTLFTLPLIAYSLARADLLEAIYAGLTISEWLAVVCTFFGILVILQRVRRASQISRETRRDDE